MSNIVKLFKVFLIYLIFQIPLFFLYYYVIFDKESDRFLPSFLVPLPMAVFASFIYFIFANMICNSEDD